MSWLSKTLKKVGKSKITRGIGKVIDFGADFVPIPGVKEGLNLGGKLLQGQNLKKAALGTAGDFAMGAVVGKAKGLLGGAKKVSSAAGLANKLGGVDIASKYIGQGATDNAARAIAAGNAGGGFLGGLKKIGGSVVSQALPQVFGAGQGVGTGGVGGTVGKVLGGTDGRLGLDDVGGFLKGGINKLGGVDGLLGAGALGYGAYQQKQAGDMRDKALKLIEQEYASRAPLREMGMKGLMNEQRPDLSQEFAGTIDNPFSRLRRVG
jgi:hypothetical protein